MQPRSVEAAVAVAADPEAEAAADRWAGPWPAGPLYEVADRASSSYRHTVGASTGRTTGVGTTGRTTAATDTARASRSASTAAIRSTDTGTTATRTTTRRTRITVIP